MRPPSCTFWVECGVDYTMILPRCPHIDIQESEENFPHLESSSLSWDLKCTDWDRIAQTHKTLCKQCFLERWEIKISHHKS